MSTSTTPGRFTAMPSEHTLAASATATEEHGFTVEVVDDLDAGRHGYEIRQEIPGCTHVVLVPQPVGF